MSCVNQETALDVKIVNLICLIFKKAMSNYIAQHMHRAKHFHNEYL